MVFPFRSDGIGIIILDDIDQLVKHLYFGDGRATVSHDLMHAISTLISATPPTGFSIRKISYFASLLSVTAMDP